MYIECIIRLVPKPPTASDTNDSQIYQGTGNAPFEIYNRNGCSIPLLDYIRQIENSLGIIAKKKMMPMQDGDVKRTLADTTKIENKINFKPATPIQIGIARFVEWYNSYY